MVFPPISVDVCRVAVAATEATPGGDLPLFVPVAITLGLAAIHLFVAELCSLGGSPRNRILSISGGATVAYVFVHVFPELDHVAGTEGSGLMNAVTSHVHFVVLLGFVTYYGLEQVVSQSGDARGDGAPSPGVFWLHLGSFAVYNGLVGYLLFHLDAPGVGALVPFAVAMALHFLVNDYGLREHHTGRYRMFGRWMLAGAVLAGGLAGVTTSVNRQLLGALFGFLAGGIVLNVIKEELPSDRESQFWAFALGAGGYALLLLYWY